MHSQQLFKKYVVLSELKKAKDEAYHKLTIEINKLVTDLITTETNRTLKKLDNIATKRNKARYNLTEASQIATQLTDIKTEVLGLLEGIEDIAFQITIKLNDATRNYGIKKTSDFEIDYFLV
jgi:hypothetical protein